MVSSIKFPFRSVFWSGGRAKAKTEISFNLRPRAEIKHAQIVRNAACWRNASRPRAFHRASDRRGVSSAHARVGWLKTRVPAGAIISGVKTFPSGSRIHGYIICTHQTNATLFGRLNVRSAVPYPASVPLHVTNMVTNRPGCGPLRREPLIVQGDNPTRGRRCRGVATTRDTPTA